MSNFQRAQAVVVTLKLVIDFSRDGEKTDQQKGNTP